MSLPLASTAFFGGTVLVLLGSSMLPPGIDGLARRLGTPPAYAGLLTALGANSPEIATAVAALVSGSHAVGYGVVIGSNLFNLAALLGLAAVVSGRVWLPPAATAFHGGVGLLVTAVGTALVAAYLAPWLAAVLIVALFVPYVVLLGLPRSRLDALGLAGPLHRGLVLARGGQVELAQEVDGKASPPPAWRTVAARLGPPLVVIVGGSVAMLEGALRLAAFFGVPDVLVGVLALAFLSGLPNLYTAVRLALAGRGQAVVSETINSNTLNVVVGISLPSLVFGLHEASRATRLEAWWLLALTAVALGLTARNSGLRRLEGALVIGAYLTFVGVRVAVTS